MSDIVVRRILNGDVQTVWQALTNKQKLKNWLPFFADFEPRKGYELRFMLGKDDNHQYEHVIRVIEIIPDKKLSFTWRYEGYPGDSIVSFELFPDGNKTNLILTHKITEPFPSDNLDFAPESFQEGWNSITTVLEQFINKKEQL